MQLIHVLNRGVEGRDLFLDERDFLRFVHNLYVFNDTAAADANGGYHFKDMDVGRPYIERRRERLVDIHGWCLMRNHYHLLLSEVRENGLSLFIKKLNGGYAKYVNERYERQGALFAGKTKRVLVDRQEHYLYILHYIHLNPLDYLEGAAEWRVRSRGHITSARDAISYLSSYRWSSYLDYAGTKNFPSLLTRQMFESRPGEYASELREYVRDSVTLTSDIAALTLE
jgi:putative transposase